MKAVSKTNLNRFSAKIKAWVKARKIKASDLDSGSATAGQVFTADGSGGGSYQDPSGMTNPMTTAGDIIVGGSSGTPTRVAKGTNGQFFVMNNDSPAWVTIPDANGESF